MNTPIPTSTPTPSRRHVARALALQALYAWKVSACDMKNIQEDLLAADSVLLDADERIAPKLCDQAYFNELVCNIPNKVDDIEEILKQYCDRDLCEVTPIEHVILWLALYELMERVEIPYKVVLNEAIMLAKEFGVCEGHRYINGVLDKAAHAVRDLATA
jgi:transcription antitermination protein NusB